MKHTLNTEITPTDIVLKTKPLQSKKLYVEDNNSVVLSLYKENDKAYAVLDFAEDNQNAHLKLAAKYYNHKVLEIAATDMEKILEQL